MTNHFDVLTIIGQFNKLFYLIVSGFNALQFLMLIPFEVIGVEHFAVELIKRLLCRVVGLSKGGHAVLD